MKHPAARRPALSIVAPCFNEEGCIYEFHRQASSAACQVVGNDYEIVLVNDGSRDRTLERLRALAECDPHVVAIDLSRNFGHQKALTAGLELCRGERILIIDADLQDPPALLADMMRLMDRGADVVYGQRRVRAGESRAKLWSAALFYRIIQRFSDVPIPVDTGDFRLMTRRTLDILNAMPEQFRFTRGMVSWIGLKQVPILYDRAPRAAGQSGYSFLKMMAFAMDAITSFSITPLRFASYTGFAAVCASLLLLAYTLIAWVLGQNLAGWTSLACITLTIGGLQLLVIGLMGEYIGRIYLETKRRPLFVINEIFTAPAGGSAEPTVSTYYTRAEAEPLAIS